MPVSETALVTAIGAGVGFVLSLFLFSMLIRDNAPARLAQHILAGAVVGYIGLVTWHEALWPRLVAPLARGEGGLLWVPAALGAVLLLAGGHQVVARSDPGVRMSAPPSRPPLWSRVLFAAGRIPVAILVGTALGAGIVGAVEGTLIPQYWRAAQIALDPTAPAGRMVIGFFTLILTTGVMVHLYVDPERLAGPQPSFVRRTLEAWMWIGRHALWFAAGVLFARLLAARMSLLIAQLQWLVAVVSENPFFTRLDNWLGR